MTTRFWHVWPSRRWPLLPDEERVFVRRLKRLAAGCTSTTIDPRGDITAVLNALRCGLSADQLVELAPGISPADLLTAYTTLERLLREARKDWVAIMASTEIGTILTHAPSAARIAQVPVYRILATAEHAPSVLPVLLTQLATDTTATRARCIAIEEAIGAASSADERIELSWLLYERQHPALWDDPMFVPERVGELTPNRVRDLLGEPR
jgi:hypothetical protein